MSYRDKFDSRMVHWHEGMVLMPQHFQQHEMLFKNLQAYCFNLFAKYPWGVCKIEIDEVLLSSGIFQVNNIECVMENGEVIFYADGKSDNEFSLKLDLKPHMNDLFQANMKVYLCMPEMIRKRYVASKMQIIEDVFDQDSTENKTYLSKLDPNILLVLSKDKPAKYISMPIAEIAISGSKVCLTDYTPPMIRLNKNHSFMNDIADIISKTRRKILYINGKMKSSFLDHSSSGSRSIEIIKCALTSNFLRLEQSFLCNYTRPDELFVNLLDFAGAICVVANDVIPIFGQYDHLNIKESFDAVTKYILRILSAIDESYEEICLSNTDNVFQLFVSDEAYRLGDMIYFDVFPSVDSSKMDMIKWVKSCIIASESMIKDVCDSRIIGAEREILSEITEFGLYAGENSVLIGVRLDQNFIKMNENIMMFNISNALNPLRVINYQRTQAKKH